MKIYVVVYHDNSRDEDYVGVDCFCTWHAAIKQFLNVTGVTEQEATDCGWHYDMDGYEVFIREEELQEG